MPQHQNYEVWLDNAHTGQRLPEHQVETTGNTVTVYVESVENLQYRVRWHIHARFTDISTQIHIDGKKTHSVLNRLLGPASAYSSGVRTSAHTRSPYMFGKINLQEDDTPGLCRDAAILENLGSIVVKVYRCHAGRTTNTVTINEQAPGTSAFSEKSKKAALSHASTYGAPVHCKAPTTTSITYIDPENAPLIVFKFLYRSRGMLEANGIIPIQPRLPAPVDDVKPEAGPSAGTKRNRESQELQELREKVARLEKRVKSEPGAVIDLEEEDRKPTIPQQTKRGPKPEPVHIDLTLDD